MNTNLAYDDWEEKAREELIGGEVVMMAGASINHNRITGNIHNIFSAYLRGKPCEPFGDGAKLFLDEDNRFIPDGMIVCDKDKIREDGVHGAPDLVVEVLSPGTMRNDKTRKKEAYARCGVREYWLVSPGDKSVEVYRTNGTEFILHDIYALHPNWELEQMTEKERRAVVTHFKCSLFDDLDISLEDIFYRTL